MKLEYVVNKLTKYENVKQVLKEGYRTGDIMPQSGESMDGITKVGTVQMGDLIAERV